METPATYPKEIAEAISAIMGEVDYVQKKGENKFHGYKFAAVGDILAKLQPAMAKHGLIVIQNEVAHHLEGAVMMVSYEFIVAHKSGVVLPERFHTTGVATATNSKGGFDDKCINKCMTAAGKYFLLSLFKIPTGEEPDADAEEDKADTKPPSTKAAARPTTAQASKPTPSAAPNGAEPSHAAWVRQAEGEIDELMSAQDCDGWVIKNTKILERLKTKSAAAYTALMTRITDRQTRLLAA